MVAFEFARGRAVAVAIAALMLLTLLPAPTQAQVAPTTTDIYVKQGELKFYQRAYSTTKATQFITGDNTHITARTVVYQTGAADVQRIPVYWWFDPAIPGAGHSGCVVVAEIPGSEAGEANSFANVTFDVKVEDLERDGYKLRISALERPEAYNGGDCAGTGDNAPTEPCGAATLTGGCIIDPNANDQEDEVPDGANNGALGYFVKGASINPSITEVRWCPGLPEDGDTGDPAPCLEDMVVEGQDYNVTAEDPPKPTFLEVVVENLGDWTDPSNYGGPCGCADDGFEYDLNITVTGNFTKTIYLTRRVSTMYEPTGEGDHEVHSIAWEMAGLTGTYNVTVKTDIARELRWTDAEPSTHTVQRNVEMRYRDFDGNITWSGKGASPSDPYVYDGPFTISGAFTLNNSGNADAGDVPYIIYIDNKTGLDPITGTLTEMVAGASRVVTFSFEASSDLRSDVYIPPGKHTVIAELDPANDTLEPNESNNNVTFAIYMADDTVPKWTTDPPKVSPIGLGPETSPTKNDFYAYEPFNVFANVTDDDAGLTVVANFTLDSNTSVHRTYNFTKRQGYYSLGVDDFDFHDFANRSADGSETWTLTVRANDSSDNNITSKSQKIKLKAWPIHTAAVKDILLLPTDWPNETVIPWDGTDDPFFKIRVLPNQTGFDGRPASDSNPCPCQQNYTANLAYNITTAKGKTFNNNGSFWQNKTPWTAGNPCRTQRDDRLPDPTGTTGGLAETCDPALNNTFEASFSKTQENAGPGRWNYSIRISDRAGHARVINGTILINDSGPQYHATNLSTDHLTPGQNFTVTVNVTDDDDTITAAHLHFERANPADGAIVNLTLSEYDTEDSQGTTYFLYNQTFKVGRNEVFGLGGTFNVNVTMSDLTGNWARTSLGQFTVTDEDAPALTSYGVVPNVAEIGENVTFYAKVADSTNVSVKLELFRTTTSSELLMDPIMLEQAPDGNFTGRLNVSAEGVYAWRITPTDSVNRAAATLGEGTLTIRDNLGPRYEIKSPATVIDDVRYGSGKPRIEVVVYDLEGVQATSLDVKVAGLPVDYAIAPAPGNLNGYLVSYVVPAAKKFAHGDLVDVNLTAIDNSSEQLQSWHNFTFKVDDTAPIARIASIAPSYRDQPGHVLNVSLNSRITLTGEDNDGMPTDVESLRYRILGGGPSAETVYTGPFKINDAPGVYTGPRLYQIQFWAEDDVGNVNPTFNVTTVYVDDTPPALFQFFPQGRAINATFVDDRVGVNRSVVWYRENTEPYVPLPLTEQDGAWSLTLPEGVKGDTVSYYLQAWDRLDNTETFGNATAPYATFSVDNHEPKVRITAPVDGSRIFRTVELTWEASDEDGDALVFTIYYKAPGKQTFTELAKIENSASRRYTLDSTRFADGQYTFRVAAGDGGFVKLSETTVTILNRASAVGVVNVEGSGVPGETMLIKAEITKAEAIVEARLFLDGDLVESYPMNDEGKDGDEAASDGIYSVRVPITTAGDYTVEIFTQYREDGELKESSVAEAASFSAKLTPGYLLTEYGAVIAIIGLLAAVGIGVAVFVVMRRR